MSRLKVGIQSRLIFTLCNTGVHTKVTSTTSSWLCLSFAVFVGAFVVCSIVAWVLGPPSDRARSRDRDEAAP